MKIIPFENLKVITITAVAILNEEIEIEPIFSLLPITHIDMPTNKRKKSHKNKIPHCDIPGSIPSARFKGNTRGIYKPGHFKNSVTIDISTITKNVCIKLSKSKIHVCGASSIENAEEACKYLISKIHQIRQEIDFINENKKIAENVVDWIIENYKGEKVIKIVEMEQLTEISEMLEKDQLDRSEDYLIHRKENNNFSETEKRIFYFLSQQSEEFNYYNDFCEELKWIISLEKICKPTLKIEKMCKAMIQFK